MNIILLKENNKIYNFISNKWIIDNKNNRNSIENQALKKMEKITKKENRKKIKEFLKIEYLKTIKK